MELIAKRSAYGDYGHVERGQVITIENDKKAKELLKGKNFAVYDRKAAEKEKAEKVAAEQALADEVLAAELEKEKAANAIELELAGLRETVAALNSTISAQAQQLAGIPALEKQIAEKDEALAGAAAEIAKLTSQIVELKAAAKATPKKTAEEKDAGSKGDA